MVPTPGLKIAAQQGFGEEFLTCFRRVSLFDRSACAQALMTRKVVVIADMLNDCAYAPGNLRNIESGKTRLRSGWRRDVGKRTKGRS